MGSSVRRAQLCSWDLATGRFCSDAEFPSYREGFADAGMELGWKAKIAAALTAAGIILKTMPEN